VGKHTSFFVALFNFLVILFVFFVFGVLLARAVLVESGWGRSALCSSAKLLTA
jgi:hypothetical protein